MDLVLFGRQGSGKGTQGKIFAERYHLQPFVTGDELRKLSNQDSELGRKIKSIVDAGHLVPNEVVMEIIENFMHQLPAETNVLFDGIPRKDDQAESFDALMQKMNRTFMGVVIEISEEESVRRLTSRRMCEKCKAVFPADYASNTCGTCGGNLIVRQDDTNMDSIRNRLDAYRDETLPVIGAYRAQNKVIEIDGTPPINTVTHVAQTALDPFFLN